MPNESRVKPQDIPIITVRNLSLAEVNTIQTVLDLAEGEERFALISQSITDKLKIAVAESQILVDFINGIREDAMEHESRIVKPN